MPRPRCRFVITAILVAITCNTAFAQLRRSRPSGGVSSVLRTPRQAGNRTQHLVHVTVIDASTGERLDGAMLSVVDGASPRDAQYDYGRGHFVFNTSATKLALELHVDGRLLATELVVNHRSRMSQVELRLHADGRLDARINGITAVLSQQTTVAATGTGGDTCDEATVLAGSGSFRFDNTGATATGPAHAMCSDFGAAGMERDVWFRWTSDCDGQVSVDTCGQTGVDTRLAVYTDDRCFVTDRDLLGCADDTCGLQSRVIFDAHRDETYLIRLGSFPGEPGGSGRVTITTACDATPLGADYLEDATQIVGLGSFSFDNTNAGADGPAHAGCNDFGHDSFDRDVWFCWTADLTGDVTLGTCDQTRVDTKIAVYHGCGAQSGAPLACNEDACDLQSLLTFRAVSGRSYLLRIGTFPGANGGVGSFTLSTMPLESIAGGDECHDAIAIESVGLFPFDLTSARSGGPEPQACTFFASPVFEHDVWYCWTAETDGQYEISTCGLTQEDTRMAVYAGCGCPNTSTEPIACDDDACGLQAAVEVQAVAGNRYLIRLGAFPGAPAGAGQLSIRRAVETSNCCTARPGGGPGCDDVECTMNVCAADPFCCDVGWDAMCAVQAADLCVSCATANAPGSCDTASSCQMPDQSGHGGGRAVAATSDEERAVFAADNFRTIDRGAVSSVCFWGISIDNGCAPGTAESFTVTYSATDDRGLMPGRVLAGPFNVTARAARTGRMVQTAAGPVDEYRYETQHAPVALEADTCYWIEIVASGRETCTWRWSTAGTADGHSARHEGEWVSSDFDLAFCLDVGLDPDGCGWQPTCIDDDPDAGPCCVPHVEPGCDTAECCQAVCSNDPFCCDAEWDQLCANAANATCTSTCDASPLNDRCVDAFPLAIPSAVAGTTLEARVDEQRPACLDGAGAGIWYELIGNGETVTVSLCPPADAGNCCTPAGAPGCDHRRCERKVCQEDPFCCDSAWDDRCVDLAHARCNVSCPVSFDARLTVLCGDCDDPVCLVSNDDACGILPEVAWCTEVGRRYLVFVDGYAGVTGDFDLSVGSDGAVCFDAESCAP